MPVGRRQIYHTNKSRRIPPLTFTPRPRRGVNRGGDGLPDAQSSGSKHLLASSHPQLLPSGFWLPPEPRGPAGGGKTPPSRPRRRASVRRAPHPPSLPPLPCCRGPRGGGRVGQGYKASFRAPRISQKRSDSKSARYGRVPAPGARSPPRVSGLGGSLHSSGAGADHLARPPARLGSPSISFPPSNFYWERPTLRARARERSKPRSPEVPSTATPPVSP